METYKIKDIYGNEFSYKCEDKKDAIKCFIAENGKDNLEENK